MRCTNCGNELKDGAKFCGKCGMAVTENNFGMPYNQPQNMGMPSGQPQYNGQPNMAMQNSQPQYGYNQPNPAMNMNDGLKSPKYVGFIDAIKLFFKNYANFKGRSTRSEFWLAEFAVFLIYVLLTVPFIAWCAGNTKFIFSSWDNFMSGFVGSLTVWGICVIIFTFGIFLPMLSLQVRRLHDIGLSGWLVLIPTASLFLTEYLPSSLEYVASLLFLAPIVVYCLPSKGDNQWGPAPEQKQRYM